MFFDPFNTLSLFDKAATVALYITLALIVFTVIVGLIVRKKNPAQVQVFNNVTIGLAVGYSIGLLGILLFLKLNEYLSEGAIDLVTFIPVVCVIGAILIMAVVGLLLSAFKPQALKLFVKAGLVVIGVAIVALLIASLVNYYKSNPEIVASREVMLYVFTGILIAIIVSIALIIGKKRENSTKSVVYAAVCMAMSFALSYIRFLELPQGGSITLASLFPIMVYSYLFGIRKGVLCGVIYGFLQFIQAPWFYHPVQFLLDYPIAFGAIGLSGILRELKIFNDKKSLQFIIGAVSVVILRYLAHVISGIFVFGSASPNYTAVAWSFLYNCFCFGDMAITIAAGSAMFASKSFVRYLDNAAVIGRDIK